MTTAYWAVQRRDSGRLARHGGLAGGPQLFTSRRDAMVWIDGCITKHIEGLGPRHYYKSVRVRLTQEGNKSV